MKKLFKSLLVIGFILILCSCETYNYEKKTKKGVTTYKIEDRIYTVTDEVTNYVLIDVEDKGVIVVKLDSEVAPITVANFQKLISEKFYDNIIFHRVIRNFMIQAGDPTGTGTGGSKENIKGEFLLNGVENNISHVRGTISMARRGAKVETSETMNSASSQFFIVQKDSTYLNGNYAAFGKVLAGMDVVDSIAAVQTDSNDKPLTDVKIKTIYFVNGGE